MAQLEGDLAEVLDLINRAVDEAGDDREALLHALMWQAYMLEIAGREDDGYDALLRARELLRPDDPRVLRVMVMTAYAYFAEIRGDPAALRLLEEAAALEGDDLIPSAGWGAGSLLGRCLMSADDLEPARRMLEDRLRRAGDVGDDEGRVSLLVFLAWLEVRAGRLDVALAHAEEASAIQESRAGGFALVAAYRGDLELAREVAERVLATSEAHGDTILVGGNRAVLGFVEFSRGQPRGRRGLVLAADGSVPDREGRRSRASRKDPSAGCDRGADRARSADGGGGALARVGGHRQAVRPAPDSCDGGPVPGADRGD
jgi:tetratricopeptide (TPR) repeat protein